MPILRSTDPHAGTVPPDNPHHVAVRSLGLDMVGPLKKAPKGFTHLLIVVDKFIKWIEARPIATIKSTQAVAFFLDIVYRFGVPNSIITDNGMQFTGKEFLEGRLGGSRASPNKRAGRARKWHGPSGAQTEDLQPLKKIRRMLGRGISVRPVEPKDDPQQGHRVHAFLHYVWLGSHPPDRPRLWIT